MFATAAAAAGVFSIDFCVFPPCGKIKQQCFNKTGLVFFWDLESDVH